MKSRYDIFLAGLKKYMKTSKYQYLGFSIGPRSMKPNPHLFFV